MPRLGGGAPVHSGEGSVLSPSWHSALLRDSENTGPVGSQWTPAVTEPWHLSPRRGVRQVIRQQSVQCYHLPVCRFQLSETREPATHSPREGKEARRTPVTLPNGDCLLLTRAAHWQAKRGEHINQYLTPVHRAKCGSSRSGAGTESKIDLGSRGAGGEGEEQDPEAHTGGASHQGLIHSSFLAGTRVRATMMGTRAREPMKRAHRGL